VVIRLFSFLARFLSRQKSYAMKRQPFSIYYEKFALAACPISGDHSAARLRRRDAPVSSFQAPKIALYFRLDSYKVLHSAEPERLLACPARGGANGRGDDPSAKFSFTLVFHVFSYFLASANRQRRFFATCFLPTFFPELRRRFLPRLVQHGFPHPSRSAPLDDSRCHHHAAPRTGVPL